MPSEEYREENIQHVLISAMRCFEEFGVCDTTLDRIAKRSGLTIRSLSRYFGTKENLIVRTLAFYNREQNAYVKNILSSEEYLKLSGYEQVQFIMEQRREYVLKYPGLTLGMADIESYLVRKEIGKELIPEYETHVQMVRSEIQEALEKGIKDGTIAPYIDKEQTTYFIYEIFNCVLKRISLLVFGAGENGRVKCRENIDRYIFRILEEMRPSI